MAERSALLAFQLHDGATRIWGELTERYERDRERGDVTASTAMTFLLVAAAIGAGITIASKITANAANVPTP